jgi:hypothetical protein
VYETFPAHLGYHPGDRTELQMKAGVGVLSLVLAMALLPATSHAVPIFGSGSQGSFTGTFEYSPDGEDSGTLEITLTNTTPVDGGYITGFVFNIPAPGSVDVTGVDFSDPDFDLLGGPSFSNSVNGASYGHFDIGAALGGSFEGGGNPTFGIGVGGTATFSFFLTGTGLGTLDTWDFLNSLSAPPGMGEGPEAMVVRFRGFDVGGSDKVPANVPEPGTALLLGLGLSALGARRLRSSARRSTYGTTRVP